MSRALLLSLLVFAAPQVGRAQEPASIPSGTAVHVFLDDGAEAAAVLVRRRGDTLLLAGPALGLARLPAGEIERLETMGRGPGAGRYALYVLGLSAAAGVLGAGETGFFPMFMNGVILFGIGGGVAYALQPPRRPVRIDPAAGLPEVRQNPSRPGVPVRIATASGPRPPTGCTTSARTACTCSRRAGPPPLRARRSARCR